MHYSVLAATLAGVVLVGWGCARYSAKPIASLAMNDALQTPDTRSITMAVHGIHHPILKPLELDFSRGLSPEEASIVAVVVNPSLRAERDARAVSAAQLFQAGLLPNPQLSLAADFPHNSDPPDDITAYNVGLEWEVTALIAHDQKVRAARADLASVELDLAWKEWQTAEAAKTAAYDVIAMREELRAAQEADDQLATNLNLVRRAFDQHQKTVLDLSAAQAASQDAHATVLSQQKDFEHQTLAMNRAVGVLPESPLKLREDVSLPSNLQPPTLDELLEGLEERRLDLLALKKGYESQDATLRAAILAQFPKISLGFNAARDTMNVHTYGLGVMIDIPLFDRNQGVIATERATRQKLFDEYMARVFDAHWDIATALADICATNDQIADAEAALPGLHRLVDTYRTALNQGNTDILSYYTAQSTLAQKQIDVVKLRQQLIENWIALEIAAGEYLEMKSAPTTREATP